MASATSPTTNNLSFERLMRIKGALEAGADAGMGPAAADSYKRLRSEVRDAVGEEAAAELDRLFPAELATAGRPWGAQAQEATMRMGQMAGWLNASIEAAVQALRIKAEAEAKAKRTGFQA